MPSSTFVKIPEIPNYWSRDRKITTLLPIAKQISKKQVIHSNHTTLDSDDIYQIACTAIINAVDKFDPSREVSLISYARKMVNWAVLEAIRTHSHASRNMIQEGKIITWLNFSNPVDGSDKTLGDVISESVAANQMDIVDDLALAQDKEALMNCINKLPEKQRDMLLYYLENDCTQKEMAGYAGLSQSRAFQLLKKSIDMIKKNLQANYIKSY